MKLKLLAPVLTVALLLTACTSNSPMPAPSPTPTPTPVSPTGSTTPTGTTTAISQTDLSLISAASTLATTGVLNLAVKQTSTRTKLANQIYSSASALWSLTGGTVPTPEEFNSTLDSFGEDGLTQYTSYTTAIEPLYAEYYAKYTSGSIQAQDVLAVINAIAQGAENGAAAYATIPITMNTFTGTITISTSTDTLSPPAETSAATGTTTTTK